jgi:hypothetical protein
VFEIFAATISSVDMQGYKRFWIAWHIALRRWVFGSTIKILPEIENPIAIV